MPGDAWLLPAGPAVSGQWEFRILLRISCCSALLMPVMGWSAQHASLRGLLLLWGVGQKHLPLVRLLWEEWQWWSQQQVPCCSQIKGFCTEGIPQLLFSFLSFTQYVERKCHQGYNWANSDIEHLLAKTLLEGQPKDQHKRAHGRFPQIPLHFHSLKNVFLLLLQEFIKQGSILLQAVFRLFHFSFLILCYVLHPFYLFSLYRHGILKRAQKATWSHRLADFKDTLV